MISANKTFLALWDYADGDVSPESLLEHFSTIQMDVGRLTGKTNYIAHHAIDDACAIVYSDKANGSHGMSNYNSCHDYQTRYCFT